MLEEENKKETQESEQVPAAERNPRDIRAGARAKIRVRICASE